METKRMRKMIEKALEDESQTGRLAELMREMVERNRVSMTDQQVKGIVDFVRGYVEHVPYYMEQGVAAARRVGLASEMEKMVGELEAYWFTADDLIPDHFGLVGLMDDAYASLVLMQAISDYCLASAGRPLLEQNLTQVNQAVRRLIGEPVATHLDARIGVTIGQAMMQRLMAQVAGAGGFSFGGGRDPIWGNASIDEIVSARLGAMGVV